MLPVCSATPVCSSHSLISFHSGLRPLSSLGNAIDIRDVVQDRVVLGISNGIHHREVSFKTQATKFVYSHVFERPEISCSMELNQISPHPNEFNNIEHSFSDKWSDSMGAINGSDPTGKGYLNYIESSSISVPGDDSLNLPDQFTQSTSILSETASPETILTVETTVDATLVSNSLDMPDDAVTKLKTNIEDFLSGISESINVSVDTGDSFVKDTLNAITSSLTYSTKNITDTIDNAFNNVLSIVDRSGELAGNGLTGFSAELKEAASKGGIVAVDGLRWIIINLEDYFARGTSFVIYYYGSTKELLPSEVRDVLNITEDKATEILRPLGTAFRQVYIAIEALETNLGLDPSDPIVPFVLFLGTSATLGVSYWVLTYGGYSGDLSPKSTLELLTREENVVLVDVRPEDLRERDGVPDLRRGARFRYASVSLPKVDGSARKLMKGVRDLDDALIAVVIRNLKVFKDRSMVIVLDADGTRSKGIARSLRKLGVQKPYLVKGGFQSWVKNGLRVKELKPETALTILNEDAAAILEDIRPTPLQVVGYGVGFVVAIYAFSEWEKTLQLIGVIGLGQTIYRRVASYEDSENFKEDVRLLLSPVKLGAQAFSWAAGKLEPNRIGLPTSPSSSAVQNRVLQAAAKHESQPSDAEETQDPSRESMAPVSDNVDLSEA